MKEISDKVNIYPINEIKFKKKGKVHRINIEEKAKKKEKYIDNQVFHLTCKSKYEKELERISKEKENKFQTIKIKSLESKKFKKKQIKNLNKNHNLLKSASNKMILDTILNNQKIKKYIFDIHNNIRVLRHQEKNKKNSLLFKYKQCHIDDINIISNPIKNKKIYKLKHSLSLSNVDLNNLKNNIIFNNIKKTDNYKNIINNSDKFNFHSQKIVNRFINSTRDETKGMLTINYNLFKRFGIKKKNNIRYLNYKCPNNKIINQ